MKFDDGKGSSLPNLEKLLESIFELSESLNKHTAQLPLSKSGVDSFELIEIRIALETFSKKQFDEEEWLGFSSIYQAAEAAMAHAVESAADAIVKNKDVNQAPSAKLSRKHVIDMPQMALGGLSEAWLFREIGDMHWNLVCSSLEMKSRDLIDAAGQRLYATFVRIRMHSTLPLSNYKENEELQFESTISRYGAGLFFTNCSVLDPENGLRLGARLVTAFTQRSHENTTLQKSEPIIPSTCIVTEEKEKPIFAKEYGEARRGQLSRLKIKQHEIEITEHILGTMSYEFNPYYEFNGVNLLYFAAYPGIFNQCERKWFNEVYFGGAKSEQDWAFRAATIARDIFYFGNCNLTDSVVVEVNQVLELQHRQLLIQSSMRRKSDQKLISRSFKLVEQI